MAITKEIQTTALEPFTKRVARKPEIGFKLERSADCSMCHGKKLIRVLSKGAGDSKPVRSVRLCPLCAPYGALLGKSGGFRQLFNEDKEAHRVDREAKVQTVAQIHQQLGDAGYKRYEGKEQTPETQHEYNPKKYRYFSEHQFKHPETGQSANITIPHSVGSELEWKVGGARGKQTGGLANHLAGRPTNVRKKKIHNLGIDKSEAAAYQYQKFNYHKQRAVTNPESARYHAQKTKFHAQRMADPHELNLKELNLKEMELPIRVHAKKKKHKRHGKKD